MNDALTKRCGSPIAGWNGSPLTRSQTSSGLSPSRPVGDPRVIVEVVPWSGMFILPSLNRTNTSDSGAPPDARISAGFMTATRYFTLPLAPTAAGSAFEHRLERLDLGAQGPDGLQRGLLLLQRLAALGPLACDLASSASARTIDALMASTDFWASAIAGRLNLPFSKSSESSPENFR